MEIEKHGYNFQLNVVDAGTLKKDYWVHQTDSKHRVVVSSPNSVDAAWRIWIIETETFEAVTGENAREEAFTRAAQILTEAVTPSHELDQK